MGWKRRVVRAAVVTAGSRLRSSSGADPGRVRRQYRPDPSWRRIEHGAAARLGPRDTIEVARPGRWKQHDPLEVTDAWRSPARSVGLAIWLTLVGVAWWRGATRGRGPLAGLRRIPGGHGDLGTAGRGLEATRP